MTRATLTRWLPAAAAAASLACQAPPSARPIPDGQIYFPTGMFFAHPAAAPETAGSLFVASSNFDRRYTNGRIAGIDVTSLGLPAFPAPLVTDPANIPSITSLGINDLNQKEIASLAGEIDGIETAPGVFRLIVPSRAEGSPLQLMDFADGAITCLGDPGSGDCSVGAPSLEYNRLTSTGVPRAPAPFSVSISKLPDDPAFPNRHRGDTFVTSLQPADSPAASATNLAVYTVKLDALDPNVTNDSFLNLGLIRTESVRMGSRYVFMTGAQSLELRLIDRDSIQKDPVTGIVNYKLFNAQVEANVNTLDTRGLDVSSDEKEVFVLSRNPDALLAMSARGTDTATPVLSLTHVELLPLGASAVRALDKPSGGRVVFVTCLGTQSYDATGQAQGSLIVFDSEAGQPVATLTGFGFAPYGLAVQTIGQGARLYVGLFGEGRIAVVDVPNLENPEDIRLVARLGTYDVCTINPGSRGCTNPSSP